MAKFFKHGTPLREQLISGMIVARVSGEAKDFEHALIEGGEIVERWWHFGLRPPDTLGALFLADGKGGGFARVRSRSA